MRLGGRRAEAQAFQACSNLLLIRRDSRAEHPLGYLDNNLANETMQLLLGFGVRDLSFVTQRVLLLPWVCVCIMIPILVKYQTLHTVLPAPRLSSAYIKLHVALAILKAAILGNCQGANNAWQ